MSPWFALTLAALVATAIALEWLVSEGAVTDATMKSWAYPALGLCSWFWIATLAAALIRGRNSGPRE